jgi:8-oxo-dGTP diphosphatase
MELVNAWTGRTACALQAALRLSNEAFASHLGVAVRTVAAWHQKPDVTPRGEMQQLLDTALERAPEGVRARFTALTVPVVAAPAADDGQRIRIAIGIVRRDSEVLLVQPRGDDGRGLSWQFPAGMVKPGLTPESRVVRETFAETGIHCGIARALGSRVHPITHVYCDYFLCEYLTGEAENRDPAENVSVTWAPIDRLTRFIPVEYIFPPILEALEIAREPDS